MKPLTREQFNSHLKAAASEHVDLSNLKGDEVNQAFNAMNKEFEGMKLGKSGRGR